MVPIVDCTTDTIAKAIIENYILIYSQPKVFLSDNASYFHADTFKAIAKFLNIKTLNSTIYYPQGNSMIERNHRNLKNYLRAYLKDNLVDNWPELVKFYTYNYNTHTNVSGYTPFLLTFGQEARLLEDYNEFIIDDSYDFDSYFGKLKTNLKLLQERTREKNIKMKEDRATAWNKHAKKVEFKVGQKVKFENRVQGTGAKLKEKYLGPAKITEICSDEYVKIEFEGKERKMNVNNLFPYHENSDSDTEPEI